MLVVLPPPTPLHTSLPPQPLQVGSPTTPNRGPGIAGPSGFGSPGQAGTPGFRAGPSPGSAAGRAGPAAASPGYAFFFSPGAGKADVKLQV